MVTIRNRRLEDGLLAAEVAASALLKEAGMVTKPGKRKSDYLHFEVCLAAERFLKAKGFGVVFRDGFISATSSGEQPDAIGFKTGISCLIEVKTSRSDFLRDRKKRFRIKPEYGMGDWRFYAAPAGIISQNDLPEKWGLLIYDNGKLKPATKFPSNIEIYHPPFVGSKYNETQVMYSALRRFYGMGMMEELYK